MNRALFLFLTLSPSPLAAFVPFTVAVRTGSAALSQGQPVIASNGFDYLAAWTTSRPFGSGVYTVRIASDGTVDGPTAWPFDPPGSLFVSSETHPHAVSLTPGRDGYFLAWLSDAGLNAAITDSYGVIEHKVTLPQEGSTAPMTMAAWNGSAHIVLSGFSGPFSATLLDNNGEVIQTDLPIGDTHGDPNVRTAVTGDDNGFFVLSTKTISFDRTDLYGRRITSSGVAGEWFLIRSIASVVTGVGVVYDGSRDVVVWGDRLGIWTMPLDSHANTPGVARQLLSAPVDRVESVIWAGNRLWIGYATQEEWKARVVTLSASGTISQPITFASGSSAPALAANSSRVLSVRLVPSPTTSLDAIGSFVSPEAAGPDFAVAYSQTLQQNGELATDGKTLLAVWDEIVPPDRHVFASRITPTHPADTREVQISTSGTNTTPAVSFNGTDYLIVWTRAVDAQHTEIVARRLSADGVLLDPAEIVLGDGLQPRVTSDGANWLIVWKRILPRPGCGNIGSAVKLYAARVSPSGIVLDRDGVALAPETKDQDGADITWNGSQYVVAWEERCLRYHQPAMTSIAAGTITRDLSRVAWSTISAEGSIYPTTYLAGPRVAATADRILVAWTNSTTPPGPPPFIAKLTIDYRLFGNSIPVAHERQRSVALKPATPPIDATFVGVGHDANGQIFVLGKTTIPTAPAYEGLFRWNISATGAATNTGMRFSFGGDEQLMGRPVHLGNIWWMPESLFSPAGGTYRLYARDFN